jgi:hypothetical protein
MLVLTNSVSAPNYMKQTIVTPEQLQAEKALLEQAQNLIIDALITVKNGLPNPEKNRAIPKLIEAGHWLRDAHEHLTAFMDRLEAEKNAKVVPITAEPVVEPAPTTEPVTGSAPIEAPMGLQPTAQGAD